jgi:hypothetical protein
MRNSGCARITLYSAFAVLAVIVLVGAGAVYVARSIRVTATKGSRGDNVSIEVPGGRLDIRGHEKLDPAALGVPIYPDAQRSGEKGGATFEWSSEDGKEDKSTAIAAADYVTSDSADKVLAWYRDHLPNWVVTTDRSGNNAFFHLTKDGYKRMIAIREKSDGTHIGVAAIGEPASN